MPGFVLQVAPVPADLVPVDLALGDPALGDPAQAAIRVGFTVSRKVGNAVVRNRVRRRLREIAREVIPAEARPGLDYVLIGRQAALTRDFAALRRELQEALKRLKVQLVATP